MSINPLITATLIICIIVFLSLIAIAIRNALRERRDTTIIEHRDDYWSARR